MSIDLHALLMEHCNVQSAHIQEMKILDCPLSFMQIRDRLYLLGNILYEDVENQIYVAAIRSGFADLGHAVIVLHLHGETLSMAGYAQEGLINQNLCANAFHKLEAAVRSEKVSSNSSLSKTLPILLFAIIVGCFLTIRGCIANRTDWPVPIGSIAVTESPEEVAFKAEVQTTVDATKKYNQAVAQFNLLVSEYNQAATLTCIDNIDGLPSELEPLKLESESHDDVTAAIRNGITKEIIEADTKTIGEMAAQIESLTSVVKQITAPTAEWVLQQLSKVSSISGTQAVTVDCDPDNLLNKDGGYAACVYFTLTSIDASTVPGDTIVEKGTDAGGAVEVYATVDEARARCDYLAGFDGTVLYSGSYAIVGTMVIRTSYKLENAQQMALTRSITRELTSII